MKTLMSIDNCEGNIKHHPVFPNQTLRYYYEIQEIFGWFHIPIPEPYQAGPEVEMPSAEPLFWFRSHCNNLRRPGWYLDPMYNL